MDMGKLQVREKKTPLRNLILLLLLLLLIIIIITRVKFIWQKGASLRTCYLGERKSYRVGDGTVG